MHQLACRCISELKEELAKNKSASEAFYSTAAPSDAGASPVPAAAVAASAVAAAAAASAAGASSPDKEDGWNVDPDDKDDVAHKVTIISTV